MRSVYIYVLRLYRPGVKSSNIDVEKNVIALLQCGLGIRISTSS